MARLGLLGRLMLVVLGALSLLVLATVGLDRWRSAHEQPAWSGGFPRADQAANIINLVRVADPVLRPAILKAVSGVSQSAEIRDTPFDDSKLIRDPRLERRLRRMMGEPADRIQAFTDAASLPRGVDPATLAQEESHGPTGRLVAATYQLSDGQVLVISDTEPRRSLMPWLLGLPLSLWVAVLGVAVAGLMLVGTRHELAPLRRLTEAVATFDGLSPARNIDTQGAPEIRHLAEAVRAMQDRIMTLLAERSMLIGAISHDLKTYLTRLRLRAEGIVEADRRERLIGDLDGMTALLETSLEFARGTAIAANRGPVDLADLVAVEIAEHAAQGACIDLDGDDEADAVVAGDPAALRRVLANLIGNAVKFGRSRVSVSVRRHDAVCEITVEDDGPGVPEAERSAVFSPFYRIERSRNFETGGTGLGLAIARQITEAHGGRIVAETARLGGARFVVSLPVMV